MIISMCITETEIETSLCFEQLNSIVSNDNHILTTLKQVSGHKKST